MKNSITINDKEINVIKLENDADFYETYFNGKVLKITNGAAYIYSEDETEVYFLPKSIFSCNPTIKVNDNVEIEIKRSLSFGKKMENSLVYLTKEVDYEKGENPKNEIVKSIEIN
jgi:hypothetical protein